MQRALRLLILCFLLASCSDGTIHQIGIEIVRPANQDPFENLTTLSFTVVNAENPTERNEFHVTPSGGFGNLSTSLRDLTFYSYFTLYLDGRNAEGELISLGRTITVPSSSFENQSLAVYFANAGTLTRPPLKMLHRRSHLKVTRLSEYQLVFSGGVERDRTGDFLDTIWEVETFSLPGYKVDSIKKDDDLYYMDQGLIAHTATPLNAATILIAGGYSLVSGDPTWADQPTLIFPGESNPSGTIKMDSAFSPRIHHQATYLSTETRVVICGGETATGDTLKDCFSVDNATQTLSRIADMTTPRTAHTQTDIYDSDGLFKGILFAGGTADADSLLEWWAADATQPTLLSDSTFPPLFGHKTVRLANGRAIIVGGKLASDELNADIYLFRESCITEATCPLITVFEQSLKTPRTHHTVTPVSESRLLVCGGRDTDGVVLSDCELIELTDDLVLRTVMTVPMTIPRMDHDAVWLPDETIMLAGGFNTETGALDSVEIFMPTTFRTE